MNRVVRKNLRVKLGDVVSIHNTGEVPYGKGQWTGDPDESALGEGKGLSLLWLVDRIAADSVLLFLAPVPAASSHSRSSLR